VRQTFDYGFDVKACREHQHCLDELNDMWNPRSEQDYNDKITTTFEVLETEKQHRNHFLSFYFISLEKRKHVQKFKNVHVRDVFKPRSWYRDSRFKKKEIVSFPWRQEISAYDFDCGFEGYLSQENKWDAIHGIHDKESFHDELSCFSESIDRPLGRLWWRGKLVMECVSCACFSWTPEFPVFICSSLLQLSLV
jgi:hypothetical protein